MPGSDRSTWLAECVINISEGRDLASVAAIAEAGQPCLLDTHSDRDHNRSVLTLAGPLAQVEAAARRVTAAAAAHIDLRQHDGVHPRLGAVDVVPFVPLVADDGTRTPWQAAEAARDGFARWAAEEFGIPCFLYGPERTLPEVRRTAFTTCAPDVGPLDPHPTAGAIAVGVRDVLIAYNIWLTEPTEDLGYLGAQARGIAAAIRRPGLRTLGLDVAGLAQVSCNVTEPESVSLEEVYDTVVDEAHQRGVVVGHGELVGLLPRQSLRRVPAARWPSMGLTTEATIEARLEAHPPGQAVD